MLKERLTGTDGFTLLEVLISLAIIAISFIALLNTHATNLDMAHEAKDITVASILAKEQIERIVLEKKNMNVNLVGQTAEEYPGLFWDVVTVDTFYRGIKEMTVSVYKAPEGGEKRSLIELKTYLN